MTNPEHLAALSDAATQGEWLANGCDIRLVDGPATWGKDEKANVAFITALVNAYRANQIAVIGPDAVERMARAAISFHGMNPDEMFEGYPLWMQCEDEQKAVLAAITGRV